MNAKVLPLPVGATHSTSEPRSIAGHTAAWTDVGVENGRPLAEDAMWSNCASLGATTLPGGGKAADGDDGTEEGGDEDEEEDESGGVSSTKHLRKGRNSRCDQSTGGSCRS